MMQAFLAGIQQQNATVNVAMEQINKTMMELARGQTQLLHDEERPMDPGLSRISRTATRNPRASSGPVPGCDGSGDPGSRIERVGRGQSQCRGLRQPMSFWPLWVTTSMMSLSTALAWEQRTPEFRQKSDDGPEGLLKVGAV